MESQQQASPLSRAETYHRIAAAMRNFQEANRALVDAAGVGPGMQIVDLGAGTGLTSQAAWTRMEKRGQLILVDLDPEALQVARRTLGKSNADYLNLDAAQWPQRVPGPVDRVLAGAAFWQFAPPEPVLAAARSRLRQNGRLAFNILGSYFDYGDGVISPQRAFAALLADRGQALAPQPPRFNRPTVEHMLTAAGFKPVGFRVTEAVPEIPDWEPGGELNLLLQLYPPAWPGHDHAERVERALGLLQRYGPELEQQRTAWRWATFVAQPAD